MAEPPSAGAQEGSELADLLHAQLSRGEPYLQVPRRQAELIYQNLRSADKEIARLKEEIAEWKAAGGYREQFERGVKDQWRKRAERAEAALVVAKEEEKAAKALMRIADACRVDCEKECAELKENQ